MKKVSTINDIFKFINFSPAVLRNSDKMPDINLTHYQATDFLKEISNAPTYTQKSKVASDLFKLNKDAVDDEEDLQYGKQILSILNNALKADNPTVGEFIRSARQHVKKEQIENDVFQNDLNHLSDTMLGFQFVSGQSPERQEKIKTLYYAYTLLDSIDDLTEYEEVRLNMLIGSDVPIFFGVIPGIVNIPFLSSPPWGRSKKIQSVGIADLMVVKQHILRYEATEIAHIENVMAKESRGRKHRFLERVEETVTLEKEITDTKERELETSERFELNKETAQTVKEDQKYGFDLSISAKYGPTVQVDSGFEFGRTESRESAAKSASNYAKNVTDRSLERIENRVREERIRKLIRETEETNKHKFNNDTDEQLVGIYQFVDKIYEAQVFNYGKRQMFDLMVPEPASYLWHLEKNPVENVTPDIPQAPEPFKVNPADIFPSRPTDSGKIFYGDLVAKYSASGVAPLKEPMLTVSGSAMFPVPTDTGPAPGGAGDSGAPRFIDSMKIKIPSGYKPVSATFSAIGSSDAPDHIHIYYTFEKQSGVWIGTESSSSHPNIRDGQEPVTLTDFHSYASENDSSLFVNVLVWDASQWAISAQIVCELTQTEIEKWQLATHDLIQAAYYDRLQEWESEVAKIESELDSKNPYKQEPVGIPPSRRENTIVTELKKHCISILTGYWYNGPSLLNDHGPLPPTFDLELAEEYATAIRFFEHAFEWHQIQYAFYPYYWASKSSWAEKFSKNDPDYRYLQFLQAGAARVMLPVRPGFEYAVNLYLDKGVIGEPESIEDGTYLSIIDQIKEQSGEELDEPIPIGESWEIRIPTDLIILKEDTDLPKWKKVEGEDWKWTPDVVTEVEG